jgi:hypothetical protein
MQKKRLPPSGDPHDYLSFARYYWPNPNSTTGLPYVRRDGESNPTAELDSDHSVLQRACDASLSLAIAWDLTRRTEFAEKAATLLKVLLLQRGTRMTPHLEFAQSIIGTDRRSEFGVLDGRKLPQILHAAYLLRDSEVLSHAERTRLRGWFALYYDWLVTSWQGRQASKKMNNHGSWFAVQRVEIALHLDRVAEAKKTLLDVLNERIPNQFDERGFQPYEMCRRNSFQYSAFNLEALVELADFALLFEIDFYESKLATGIATVVGYAVDETWPYPQLVRPYTSDICPILSSVQERCKHVDLSRLTKICSCQRRLWSVFRISFIERLAGDMSAWN